MTERPLKPKKWPKYPQNIKNYWNTPWNLKMTEIPQNLEISKISLKHKKWSKHPPKPIKWPKYPSNLKNDQKTIET